MLRLAWRRRRFGLLDLRVLRLVSFPFRLFVGRSRLRLFGFTFYPAVLLAVLVGGGIRDLCGKTRDLLGITEVRGLDLDLRQRGLVIV